MLIYRKECSIISFICLPFKHKQFQIKCPPWHHETYTETTPDRWHSKASILSTNVDQKYLETELLIDIIHQTDNKWQSTTLFLSIFYQHLSIVKAFSIAAYLMWNQNYFFNRNMKNVNNSSPLFQIVLIRILCINKHTGNGKRYYYRRM